jgi:ribosome biogenesis GTPase / thiamine phosphate phosphatase
MTSLSDLGYDNFFESSFTKLKEGDFSVARVIVEYRGVYKVKNENGEYLAKVTGKRMFDALSREDYPAVGDWVLITLLNDEQAVIQGILPRKTLIKRKEINKNGIQIIATNIDVAFVVESIGRDYNLNRFERYFSIANDGGIQPVIILNKVDLISKGELDIKLSEIKDRFPGITIILTSTVNDEGLEELKNSIIKGKTYCFLGSSGVGKSSLINKLLGEKAIKTEDVSVSTGRGKHATTTREMYFIDSGGVLIDNPGMRDVGMTDSADIDNFFKEVAGLALNCRYADCTHVHESDCAVLAKIKSGELDREKYSNYIRLKKEAEYFEMSEPERKEKDREFGKFVKSAKKQLKSIKNHAENLDSDF